METLRNRKGKFQIGFRGEAQNTLAIKKQARRKKNDIALLGTFIILKCRINLVHLNLEKPAGKKLKRH